tara:strand:+ start:209 stop:466 length:258 start_codon:yes stop_codon:yes gene_type:complete
MDYEQEFNMCKEYIIEKDNITDNNTLLKLYGLHQQATIGSNKHEEPSIIFLKEYCKWESWDKYKHLTKMEAKQQFIEYAKKLLSL